MCNECVKTVVLWFQLGVIGAGFSSSSDLKCLYTKSDDDSVSEGEVVQRYGNTYIICQADLDAGKIIVEGVVVPLVCGDVLCIMGCYT